VHCNAGDKLAEQRHHRQQNAPRPGPQAVTAPEAGARPLQRKRWLPPHHSPVRESWW
jgi:hypothetical protein